VEELEAATNDRSRWLKYTEEVLKHALSTDQFAREIANSGYGVYSMDPSPQQRLREFHRDMDDSLNVLISIIERLEVIPGQESHSAATPTAYSDRVFIVHGHDEGAREAVARFVTDLGLIPIILHEQPNKGRTIIDKLEGQANVGFAVILLTPDDLGGSSVQTQQTPSLSPRARQNVIFELGFFCGALGRPRVCALRKGDLEEPSDYHGVVYVEMDERGAWKLALAREMKEAGLKVDLNKVI